MTNSRRKGADYEREIATMFRAQGLNARRGQQYSGANGDPDVIVEDLPGYHLELKRRARTISATEMYKYMGQSADDAREDEVPVVIHRIDGEKSLVTMRLEDWIRMAKKAREENDE